MNSIWKTIILLFLQSTFLSGQTVQETWRTELKVLDNEYWWGGAVVDGSRMPYGSGFFTYGQLGDVKGNQAQPLLISSKGRYVWSEGPMTIEFANGLLRVTSRFAKIDHGTAGTTLREAFLYVANRYFPPSGKLPDTLLFSHPQYNTWIELQYNQNEQDILQYARDIIDKGFPPGVLMIDDNWQVDYGNWDFSAERFQNPRAMVDTLHALGFKVMLWVCPFISPDSEVYRDLAARGLLLHEDAERSRPAIVRWWNGASALVDLTHPEGKKWYLAQLDNLQKKYGVDGFKLDAGDPEFYLNSFAYRDVLPNTHTELHAAIGLKFPLNEFRAGWKMAGQALAQRLRDKEHTWEHLQQLIPGILAQGLMGYAFTCPDMIGGGEVESFTDSTILDQELIVRSAQSHALMPMMQFSVAPWRVLSPENLEITREMAMLHRNFGAKILEIAKSSAKTGEPVVRSMEYMYPHRGYWNIRDQFMLGERILVAPVVKKGQRSRYVYFPPGIWRGDDGSVVQGPAHLEIEAPLSRLPWYRKVGP
jgi:alpha-glucosidase (family GH31 glycosyl hydrolase)